MKAVTFQNQMSRERVICEDLRDERTIDGVQFLLVHRYGNDRSFLVRKDSLKKVDEPGRK